MPDPGAQYRNSKSYNLTAMRERMNREIDARIILGGKVKGYSGKYPGIMEETALALESSTPVYIIGAFGGASRCIIDMITKGFNEPI